MRGELDDADVTLRELEETREFLADLREELFDGFPEATIDLDVRAGTQIRADPGLLTVALSNLVENGLDHGDEPYASVSVSQTQDGRAECVVTDRNERINEAELAPIRAGDETQLEHGSSIGLWIVTWSVTAMGADIDFGYDDGNVVTITLPDRI